MAEGATSSYIFFSVAKKEKSGSHELEFAALRHALAKVHWEGGGKLPTGEDLIIRRSTHAQQKNRQHT